MSIFRAVSCSYEGFLFGWDIIESQNEPSLDMKLIFSFSVSHQSLKAVALSGGGKFLACGGIYRFFDVCLKNF
jgi:hypothetical protein